MSRWFAAHVIMVVEYKEHDQKSYPAWENVILLRAASPEEAFAKAERHGRAAEGDDDGTFTWDGKPARWIFAGVRKLAACEDSEMRPGDGTEITYLQLRVRSRDALVKMMKGHAVGVEYIEEFKDAEV